MSSLELKAVGKAYGRKRVLQDVSLTLEPGLTLLVGPSGAGKSTLLRLIATAERPSKGAITWSGPGGLRRALGYAPQAVDLPEDLTAREFAMHIAALKGLRPGQADKQFGAIPMPSASMPTSTTASPVSPAACAGGSSLRKRCWASPEFSRSTNRRLS